MSRSIPLCLLLVVSYASRAADAPVIFWTNDPVQPNETVLVAGGNFGADCVVELARIESDSKMLDWTKVAPLQVSEQCLKCVIPAEWKPGAYAIRVHNGDATSETHCINAPDLWWLQGDAGDSATPGGSIRVFGRSLRLTDRTAIVLTPEKGGDMVIVKSTGNDEYSAQGKIPDLPPGVYKVQLTNGFAVSPAALSVRIAARKKDPDTVFDVMDFYGKEKERELQRTIRRGSKPVDRTEAILAALKKAEQNGGGVVYFPAGIYGILKELHVPPHTTLKGEGMGTAVLRWGSGEFALDGGGSQKRDEAPKEDFPGRLIFGDNFKIEDMSIYVPLDCSNAIQTGDNFAMNRVRVRTDRYWMRSPQRQNGVFLRVGSNFTIADCDMLVKGSGIAMGSYGVLQRNKIQSGKCHCELGHASQVIVEDNQLISLDPTAYINVYEEGRNIYYARNKHESQYAHESDFSFTFDGPGGAYLGGIAACEDLKVTLAADPTYVKWANEAHGLWRRSALCILAGKGAGQYRYVTANHGREWAIDRAFDIKPDATSVLSIVPFRGKALVIGNRFEDANWVNMGYGSSMEVVCAKNTLVRCGQMLNYGLKLDSCQQPSWYVQYLDNDCFESHTLVETSSAQRVPAPYEGTVTRWCVHRGTHLHADDSGNMRVAGIAVDTLIEHCVFDNAAGFIENVKTASGTVLRGNTFAKEPCYKGEGALIVP